MTSPAGEMPFLDHLEELRVRIFKVLAAVVAGVVVGFWVVQRFKIIAILKQPIEPYLPSGKLTVLSPTEPILIVLKLALVVGLVLASPVIIYQVWAFLSPALYAREKRALIPGLVVGLFLFLVGAAGGFLVIVPAALRILLSIEPDTLQTMITFGFYFSFVTQLSLAMGASFELPLLLMLLTWLGVVTPAKLRRFRRFALVLAALLGALLTPADVTSMVILTSILVVLYEVGVLGSVLVAKRRARTTGGPAALLVVGLLMTAGSLSAQVPTKPPLVRPPKTARTPTDTVTGAPLPQPGQALDTASARRVGLPTGPTRQFAQPDSMVQALLARPGFRVTRYSADTATLFAAERRMLLDGRALTEREGTTLEADHIRYRDAECLLDASGDPRLFDAGSVLVGEGIGYNTCTRRGFVTNALTSFPEGSTVWFLRGNIAQDSSSSRIYAASSEITSCDLPEPHYHFAAREVKWISKNVLVARPAVLYISDVPVLWLPFVFQDTRPGRRSGILVPQFGLNDLVRTSGGYSRQVTNVGYYWAPNDYIDITGRLDWYSDRYLQLGLAGRYRWLNRFANGELAYSNQRESGGASSTSIRWLHQQSFDLTTSVNLSFNYVSNTTITSRNAIDPLLNTQQITSALNLSKRYRWGTVTLGGNRRQSLSDNSTTTQFPAITISPKPLDIASDITWSPSLSFVQNRSSNTPGGTVLIARAGGGLDSLTLTGSSRTTSVSVATPFRIGSFNWQNTLSLNDRKNEGRIVETFRVPDPGSSNPADSLTVSRVTTGDFETGIDWTTGINLPVLLRRTWKLQPVLGIANTTGGPFLLRNRRTGGDFVSQGKRFALVLNVTPTVFGFLPGFGPLSRIRHSVSPIISYSYSPKATIPEDYARAITPEGQAPRRTSDAAQRLSIGLSQNFEGKTRPAAGDTSDTPATRKLRLLSIATSPIVYDFEQAKKPGRTGWVTSTLTNTFQTDLLPSFSLSMTHDLWRGAVGTDTAKFDPFLQNVNMGFALSTRTVRSFLGLFGLGSGSAAQDGDEEPPPSYLAQSGRGLGRTGAFNTDMPEGGARRPFSANVNFSLSRVRPLPGATSSVADRQNLGFSTSFSPTPFWGVSWSTQYNITDKKFESQIVRLERDLHDWRARFEFIRNANGNFAFFFSIYLTSLPDLKFDYDQRTISN